MSSSKPLQRRCPRPETASKGRPEARLPSHPQSKEGEAAQPLRGCFWSSAVALFELLAATAGARIVTAGLLALDDGFLARAHSMGTVIPS